MKLYISQVGIFDSVSNYFSDINNSLNSCRYISLICPSSFSYASYVNNLKSKISLHQKEVTYIQNALRKVERNYDNLFDDNVRKVNSIVEKKMDIKSSIPSDLIN